MKETVAAIKAAGLRDSVKIMIGGGTVDDQVRQYAGADAFGLDAMAAVTLAKGWTGGNYMSPNPIDKRQSVEQLLAERAKRLQDALELKQPDRIPLNMAASYLLAEFGGITHQELQDNGAKAQEILEKFALEFEPDTLLGLFNSPWPSLALGDRMTKWPGYGLPASGSSSSTSTSS